MEILKIFGWGIIGYLSLSMLTAYSVAAGQFSWAPYWLLWPWDMLLRIWGG